MTETRSLADHRQCPSSAGSRLATRARFPAPHIPQVTHGSAQKGTTNSLLGGIGAASARDEDDGGNREDKESDGKGTNASRAHLLDGGARSRCKALSCHSCRVSAMRQPSRPPLSDYSHKAPPQVPVICVTICLLPAENRDRPSMRRRQCSCHCGSPPVPHPVQPPPAGRPQCQTALGLLDMPAILAKRSDGCEEPTQNFGRQKSCSRSGSERVFSNCCWDRDTTRPQHRPVCTLENRVPALTEPSQL